MRTVWWTMAALFAGLLALSSLGADDAPRPARARPATTDVRRIAARVETLRGLRFAQRPVPQRVSGARARREGLEDLDRSYPVARRRVDEEVLKRLGLLAPAVDLRAVSASVFGEGVAGYYDPRSKRLRIVDGAATRAGALADITLAHELTHALEDQRFGLSPGEGSDDRSLARLALIEGSATLVMQEYLARYVGAGAALGGLLGSAAAGPDLPPFLAAQLLFPYLGGLRFVQALRTRAGGGWTLVDLADRLRPPDSTEQVLHPRKWVAVETPEPVSVRPGLKAPWRRTGTGVWGEWQTRELLGGGSDATARAAAAGWGGDRYELWQRPAAGCAAPCRRADVLVLRWRWDTPRDVREFAAALRASAVAHGGAVAVRDDAVTLALAPTRALARRVAASR